MGEDWVLGSAASALRQRGRLPIAGAAHRRGLLVQEEETSSRLTPIRSKKDLDDLIASGEVPPICSAALRGHHPRRPLPAMQAPPRTGQPPCACWGKPAWACPPAVHNASPGAGRPAGACPLCTLPGMSCAPVHAAGTPGSAPFPVCPVILPNQPRVPGMVGLRPARRMPRLNPPTPRPHTPGLPLQARRWWSSSGRRGAASAA